MSGKDEIKTYDNDNKIKKTTSEWLESKQISDSIEQMKKLNPEAYKRAQEFGEFIMNTRISNPDNNVEKKDIEGDEILFKKIKRDIEYFGLIKEDLNEFEINILKGKLGDDYEKIFCSN